MKLPSFLLSLLFLAGVGGICAGAATPLAQAVETRLVSMTALGNGRDEVTLTLKNPASTAVTATISAGQIFAGAAPTTRFAALRAATVEIAGQSTVEVTVPVAALSTENSATAQTLTLAPATEPRLFPLLKALADQPDAPRSTAQLAVLALLEDVTFAQWRRFFAGPALVPPTPAEVTQAIDALGLLRVVAPERRFALSADADLKRLALRNPWSRGKAMAIYGLDLGDGAVPPDLRQLLHTQVGDNCPICRQRSLMQSPADAP